MAKTNLPIALNNEINLNNDVKKYTLEIDKCISEIQKNNIINAELLNQRKSIKNTLRNTDEIQKLKNEISDLNSNINNKESSDALENPINDFIKYTESKGIELKNKTTTYSGIILKNLILDGKSRLEIISHFKDTKINKNIKSFSLIALAGALLTITTLGPGIELFFEFILTIAILIIIGSISNKKIYNLSKHPIFKNQNITNIVSDIEILIGDRESLNRKLNKLIDNSLKEENKISHEISKNNLIIKKLENEIEDYKNIINNCKRNIELEKRNCKLRIELEKQIKLMPIKAIGVIKLSQKLNEKSKFINDIMLNKITRFITYIEKAELDYNSEYNQSIKNYISNPEIVDLNLLENKINSINQLYKTLATIIFSSEKDKVLFNKLYNDLEDKGIFNTSYEKKMFSMFMQIIGSLDYMQNQIEGLSDKVDFIQSDLWDLNSEIEDLNSKVDDLS